MKSEAGTLYKMGLGAEERALEVFDPEVVVCGIVFCDTRLFVVVDKHGSRGNLGRCFDGHWEPRLCGVVVVRAVRVAYTRVYMGVSSI